MVEPATEVDVAAEFARHDDLVETGRHSAVDHEWVSDTGRHHVVTETGRHYAVDIAPGDDAEAGPLTHRTVITRPSTLRRWIPAGVGAGVLSIVAAVLLTSGFASSGAPTGTDEAARTGGAGADAPASTTPAPTVPGMGTIDLSGTVAPGTVDAAQPDLDEPATRAQPQVATTRPPRPAARRPSSRARAPVPARASGTGTGHGHGHGHGHGQRIRQRPRRRDDRHRDLRQRHERLDDAVHRGDGDQHAGPAAGHRHHHPRPGHRHLHRLTRPRPEAGCTRSASDCPVPFRCTLLTCRPCRRRDPCLTPATPTA